MGRLGSLGGGLGEVFGALGGLLGSSFCILGAHGSFFVVWSSTRCGDRADLSSKKEPRWHPNRDRKRIKIDMKNRNEKRSSQDGLGAILKRCWVVSSGLLELKKVKKCWKSYAPVKICFFKKIRLQEAIWAELKPTWAAKSLQKGAQERAKTEQKRKRKAKRS